MAYDKERKLFLQHFGVKVIRFENRLVFDAREAVANRVRNEFGWWRVLPDGSE